MRFLCSLSGLSLFRIDNGFLFSRGDIVSGCLSLCYGGVGWAWALSFVDVFFVVADVSDSCLYARCVVVVGAFD